MLYRATSRPRSAFVQILVVEDNPITLAVIASIARRIPDACVVDCSDPLEAMIACRGRVHDLVLIDYMMPGMNGIESSAPCAPTSATGTCRW